MEALDRAAAAHLLRRIAFVATESEIERTQRDGPEATLKRHLGAEEPAAHEAADAVDRAVRQLNERDLLSGALLHRLAVTVEPARERLVLFFHNHFVSALSKVGEGRMMQAQLALLRRHGPGPFRELARRVSRDPAMVRYLDSERSSRTRPNENFARELMELFTMGRGPYDERDVKEAARAFTGYHLRGGSFRLSAAAHDDGDKEVLGRRGALTGDQVVDLCVDHPQTALFMARKLARAFVADDPAPEIVEAIARSWRRRGGVIRQVLEDLVTAPWFYLPVHRLAVTRSPAMLVTACQRGLGVALVPVELARAVASMGQTLIDPPTVKGYDGGPSWLNPATLLARRSFIMEAASRAEPTSAWRPAELAAVLVGAELEDGARRVLDRARDQHGFGAALGLLLCHPLFQSC